MGWNEKKRYLRLIRFEVLSNELQNLRYGLSASGAEWPIMIPSTYQYSSTSSTLLEFLCSKAPEPEPQTPKSAYHGRTPLVNIFCPGTG